jgi:uncharacterized membrane protein YecN with MAPEG domain
VLIDFDAQSTEVDPDDQENAWQARYRASIAAAQRARDTPDQSLYAKTIRADAYIREALILIGLMVGAIVMISTGNPWWIFVGAVLLATVLLGVIGMARGRSRT